jgi:hypothetical protein
MTLNGLQAQSQTDRGHREGGHRPMLDVALQFWLFDLATNETLRVKDRVGRVRVECIFRGVTDPSYRVFGHEGRGTKENTYSRSSSVKATHEGVIRWPWSLAMISTRPPRCTLEEKGFKSTSIVLSRQRTQHKNN